MYFRDLFKSKKPVIGMIHLAGENNIAQAIKELIIYEKCKVSGAILENYHGSVKDVYRLINIIKNREYDLAFGVNILGNYKEGFKIAKENSFIKFMQIDAISGDYYEDSNNKVYEGAYSIYKENSASIVMGGVWPKYYTPLEGSNLEKDLYNATKRCEAIVVTGSGTGKETPIEKIKKFREAIGDFPLIVGAGITEDNAVEQLSMADACIIGSYFKNNSTTEAVKEEKVQRLMDIINDNF